MTFAQLNPLENAVLKAMCDLNLQNGDANALRSQLIDPIVTRRQNTGHGFYTWLTIKDKSKLIKTSVIDGVDATISGFIGPMLFILFSTNGIIDFLEGAATAPEDDTTEVDFSSVQFQLL
jgi:hypothetical protein